MAKTQAVPALNSPAICGAIACPKGGRAGGPAMAKSPAISCRRPVRRIRALPGAVSQPSICREKVAQSPRRKWTSGTSISTPCLTQVAGGHGIATPEPRLVLKLRIALRDEHRAGQEEAQDRPSVIVLSVTRESDERRSSPFCRSPTLDPIAGRANVDNRGRVAVRIFQSAHTASPLV